MIKFVKFPAQMWCCHLMSASPETSLNHSIGSSDGRCVQHFSSSSSILGLTWYFSDSGIRLSAGLYSDHDYHFWKMSTLPWSNIKPSQLCLYPFTSKVQNDINSIWRHTGMSTDYILNAPWENLVTRMRGIRQKELLRLSTTLPRF